MALWTSKICVVLVENPEENKQNEFSLFFPGDEMSLVYDGGSDTTPLYRHSTSHYNGFSGFRL